MPNWDGWLLTHLGLLRLNVLNNKPSSLTPFGSKKDLGRPNVSRHKPANAAISGDTHRTYELQASSMLMAKLPLELRDMIWEHVLGGNLVHMYWKDKETLLSYICSRQKECESLVHDPKKNVDWDSAAVIREDKIDQRKGWMPLLLSCRAIYFEASKILYSANTFDFTDHWSNFPILPWLLPISGLTRVTRISISCHRLNRTSAGIDSWYWERIWETLALCTSLRYLHVELVSMPDRALSGTKTLISSTEDEYLEPVKKVCGIGIKFFELVLPFEEEAGGRVKEELRAAGCIVIRK
ncbi:hypothetical protein BCR34DRAFT_589814 [Clohesyomyces aquaticus]|uniref:DUF7730 domain-containing protein n=1 Tax=Clohesyomyces aquaticus TaxID=1231657 RepID=A0A1Y1ZEQ1_9PLEO|nr:hypothetical protein BCR34DRAFT_589814 [Clohesyomyces aquaticus]